MLHKDSKFRYWPVNEGFLKTDMINSSFFRFIETSKTVFDYLSLRLKSVHISEINNTCEGLVLKSSINLAPSLNLNTNQHLSSKLIR